MDEIQGHDCITSRNDILRPGNNNNDIPKSKTSINSFGDHHIKQPYYRDCAPVLKNLDHPVKKIEKFLNYHQKIRNHQTYKNCIKAKKRREKMMEFLRRKKFRRSNNEKIHLTKEDIAKIVRDQLRGSPAKYD